VNAVALAPEVAYPVPNVNDDAQHVAFVRRAADGWSRGENVVDLWVPEFELGVPQFLDYQHLPHVAVALLGRLTLGAVDLRTLFDLVRYLLLLAFPLTVFRSMRTMGFNTVASAIAAAASSLLMASPSYLAFALPAGEHFIVAEYRSTPIKTPLLVLGAFVLMGTGVARVGPRRLASSPDRVRRLWQTLRVQWSKQRAGRD